MFNTLIRQLLLLLIATGLVSCALFYLGIPLFIGIPMGLIIQYACYNAFVYAVDTYAVITSKKLEVEGLKQAAYQGMEVECPCAQRNRQFVPIRLNSSNYYKCKQCSKTLSAFTAVETVLVTEPIADTSLQDVENLLDKIK